MQLYRRLRKSPQKVIFAKIKNKFSLFEERRHCRDARFPLDSKVDAEVTNIC